MEEKVYNFMRADENGKQALRAELISAFEQAERLCAYNAVLFNIPFMHKQLGLPQDVIQGWLCKLCDPFHTIKTCFSYTCKLDKMLALNGLESKSATGLQAIDMARNGDWDALVDYCMDDVRLTVQLCTLAEIALFPHIDGFWIYCSYQPHLRLWGANARVQQPAAAQGTSLQEEGKTGVEELVDFVDVCERV